MEMGMVDGLTGQFTHIGDHTVTIGKAQFLGQLGDNSIDMTDNSGVFFGDFSTEAKCALGITRKWVGAMGAMSWKA